MNQAKRWDANRVSNDPAMLCHENGMYVLVDDYIALQAENKRLCLAGDAFIGAYLFASAKGLVSQDTAVKVIVEWSAAKGVQS